MKNRGVRHIPFVVCFSAGAVFLGGCASTSESAQSDRLTANVGNYPLPPGGVQRPRVGIPPFSVQVQGGVNASGEELNSLAADQMTTLLHLTQRFDAIERAQLQKLIDEQNLEGIVKGGELAKPGLVRGVDFLLLGKVTNFRVKADHTGSGLDVGGGVVQRVSGGWLGGSSGFERKETRITSECGVDIRLVDPTTGKIAAAHFGEFKRTDSANALGVSLLGVRSTADANLQIQADDAGKILRLAFDEAVKKILPQIDEVLVKQFRQSPAGSTAAGGQPTPAAATGAEGARPQPSQTQPVAAKKFCSQCGTQVAGGSKFCGGCGAKVE